MRPSFRGRIHENTIASYLKVFVSCCMARIRASRGALRSSWAASPWTHRLKSWSYLHPDGRGSLVPQRPSLDSDLPNRPCPHPQGLRHHRGPNWSPRAKGRLATCLPDGHYFYIGSVIATKLFGATSPGLFGNLNQSAYNFLQIMTLKCWSMGIVRPVMEVYLYASVLFVRFTVVTTFAVINLLVCLLWILCKMHITKPNTPKF